MKTNIKAFTLMEILVAVSILATVSVVAYVSYAGHIKSVNNATRVQAIDTLHLSLSDYFQMKKTLPEPKSNAVFYDERGTYMHSSSGSYGVSGHASQDFLPAGYVNFRATDPESNQFYGYGKLTDSTSFDIAAALYDEATGGYKTYLRGTYPKQRLASLVRSYSSSNFVSQNSTEELPYNPYERKVNAYISSYSGTVTLTGSVNVKLDTPSQTFTGELNSGDTIIVATGSTALLHISDGSELSLGSSTTQTELKLDTLEYSDDNNLASKVKLLLSLGEVWVEAPRLRTESDSASDFSLQTDSAVAAVRGTVFGVSRSSTGVTAISLVSGKLEVDKITADGTSIPFTVAEGFNTTEGFVIEDTQSYMIVPEWGTPIKLDGIVAQENAIGTSDISVNSEVSIDMKDKIHRPPFSLGYRPKADSISFTGTTNSDSGSGTLSVTFQNPGADSYELSFGTGEVDDSIVSNNRNPNLVLTGTLVPTQVATTITGTFPYIGGKQITRNYTLRICFRGKCSAPDIKGLGGETFDFENFRVWGEKEKRCSFGQKTFATFGCQDENLVAYAPYDTAGDLKLYGTGGILDYGNDSASIINNTNACFPQQDGVNLWFNSTCGWVLPTNNYNWLWAGTIFDANNSFFSVPSQSVSGIFIDKVWTTNDYLKYTIPPLDNNFSIEMSVRGGALKREHSTSGYVLFDILWTTGSGFRLSTFKNEWLYLWHHDLKNNQIISLLNLNTKITDNNKFYRVVASYNNPVSKIEIFDESTSILLSTSYIWWYSVSNINPWDITFLNIWSYFTGSNYIWQWNDIIDSVKIYK